MLEKNIFSIFTLLATFCINFYYYSNGGQTWKIGSTKQKINFYTHTNYLDQTKYLEELVLWILDNG
jgi:hypothetical protein